MQRREFIKNTSKILASTIAFPNILTAKNKFPTIRVLGTHVTLQEIIRRKAMHDLKINIEFYPGGSAEVLTKAIANPSSFDIYEQWTNSTRLLWESNSIQSIDINKLKYWDEINRLPKKGSMDDSINVAPGDAPNKILYIQNDNTLNQKPTNKISFMPYVHNVDSFGYNTDLIKKGIPYETESWSWLLYDDFRNKVAIVNEPTIGLFDLILAVKAKGLMDFNNIADLSKKELKNLFRILIEYKEKGHFRSFWNSVPHSIELMKNKEVSIESMFSPAVSQLNEQNIPCTYAAPKEGYRAWYGVMSLSSKTVNEQKEAAYEYMNWWLSGWAGAYIAKQGYYISNPLRSKNFMEDFEWEYWYEGKYAKNNILGIDNKIIAKEGEFRTGGSYKRRFSNIAVWNTVMKNFDYSLDLWKELLSNPYVRK